MLIPDFSPYREKMPEDYADCTLVVSMHYTGVPSWRDTGLACQSQWDYLLLLAPVMYAKNETPLGVQYTLDCSPRCILVHYTKHESAACKLLQ